MISKATKFKKHAIVKHFSHAKVDDMKHCMKVTQEKSPAQIIFRIGTKRLVTNEKLQCNSKNLLKPIKTRKQYQAQYQEKIS